VVCLEVGIAIGTLGTLYAELRGHDPHLQIVNSVVSPQFRFVLMLLAIQIRSVFKVGVPRRIPGAYMFGSCIDKPLSWLSQTKTVFTLEYEL
jgi:hypothetical protein